MLAEVEAIVCNRFQPEVADGRAVVSCPFAAGDHGQGQDCGKRKITDSGDHCFSFVLFFRICRSKKARVFIRTTATAPDVTAKNKKTGISLPTELELGLNPDFIFRMRPYDRFAERLFDGKFFMG
jgi:hypothetical protein